MRLVNRLLLSHAAVAGVLLVALAVPLVALFRMTAMIGEVRRTELGAVQDEEDLHRAGWAIEVVARHGITTCAEGGEATRIAAALEAQAGEIDTMLARAPGRVPWRIPAVVARYRDFARRVAAGPVCARLRSQDAQAERIRLDEELTDAWVTRLAEVHRVIARREGDARSLGARASTWGVIVALAAWVGSTLVARWTARRITRSLAQLARAAHRVGAGDFSPIPPVKGTVEVEELARDLDHMRARLLEYDRLKQSFVASVSHEMRTPLTKLREALALVGDGTAGTLNDRQARVVRIARDACERQIRTVSALLDLSRLRAGRGLKRESGCGLDEVLRAATRDEAADAEPLGITVEIVGDGYMPPADLDPPLVERAVANLVRNAISVSTRGQTVRVTRSIRDANPQGEAGPWFVVAVADEGPGVPAEIRDRLFEAFATHAVEGRPVRDGIGLGLALVREVARAHGGEARLGESGERGAVFELWLPAKPSRSIAPKGLEE